MSGGMTDGAASTPRQAPVDASGDLANCVLACLCARHDPAALSKVWRAIASGRVTWDGLRQALVDARLDGLAYPVLCDQPGVPRELLAELRQAYAGYAVRNTLMLAALEDAVGRLAAAGIPTLVLKGAALIESIYPSLGQRPMNDLDVLVPHDRAAAADRVLCANGYAWSNPTDLAATLEFENELMLQRAGPVEVAIELHWHLINAPHYQRRIPMAWFWETARPIHINGSATLMLGAEAQLLHLCSHLVLHHGQAAGLDLRLLVDVAELLRQTVDVANDGADRTADHQPGQRVDGIDWALVLRRAQAWDLVIALQRVLPDAAARLGAPVPATALAELRRLRPRPEEARVVAALTTVDAGVAERFWTDLAGLSGTRARLRFIRYNLFPSADYMRQRYGHRGAVPPWAYLYRWWLGARDAARAARRSPGEDADPPRIESGASRVSMLE